MIFKIEILIKKFVFREFRTKMAGYPAPHREWNF